MRLPGYLAAPALFTNEGARPMDLRYTADELAFRDELRAFFRDKLPGDIRERMRLGHASERRAKRTSSPGSAF